MDGRGFQALTGRAKGYKDSIIHVCKTLCPFGLKRANNVESLIIYKDRFSNRVSTRGGKKILNYGLPEHSYRSACLFILVTKPGAFGNLPTLNCLVTWI